MRLFGIVDVEGSEGGAMLAKKNCQSFRQIWWKSGR